MTSGWLCLAARTAMNRRDSETVAHPLVPSRAHLGAFMTYRFSDHVRLDGALSFFPQNSATYTSWKGGGVICALGGLLVGTRTGAFAGTSKRARAWRVTQRPGARERPYRHR